MIDYQLIFDGTASDPPVGTAITANATTQASTNIIDWLSGRDVGAGEHLAVHVDITTAFTTTNSATLQIALQVCSTTNGTYLTILQGVGAIPAAQLIIGAPLFRYRIPVNQILNATAGVLGTPGQYMRLLYTVGTGVFSAGSVFSYINAGEDRNEYVTYKNNYSALTVAGQI